MTLTLCACGCGSPARRRYLHGHSLRARNEAAAQAKAARPTTCTAPDCAKPVIQDDLCAMHRSRLARYGTLDLPTPTPQAELFWRQVDKSGDCWLWTGALWTDGYGRFSTGGRRGEGTGVRAHRFAYEDQVGPIPDGLALDHLCHTNDPTCPGGDACAHVRCVNPTHLEVVTSSENVRRANAQRAAYAELMQATEMGLR